MVEHKLCGFDGSISLKMFVPKQQAAFIDVRALYIVRISYLACKLGNNRFELTWEINDTSNWNVLDLLKIEIQLLDSLPQKHISPAKSNLLQELKRLLFELQS